MSARVPTRPRRPAWLPALGSPRTRTAAAVAAGLVLLVAGWLWLRDSSLVAVRDVEISGIARDTTQGARVRAALEDAGRSMTTLHVRQDALDTAVAPYSLVKELEVDADFPRTLKIHVVTNVAVGAVVVDGRRIPVTSDGTLLRDVAASPRLPTIPLESAPGGRRLETRAGLLAVAALGAAPDALRARVEDVRTSGEHGLEIQLAHGPALWFGDGRRLGAKWAAAAAILADEEAAGATYIDVAVPERPAVGGLAEGAPATSDSDLPALPEGSEADPAAGDAEAGATDDPAAPAAP